MGADGEVRDNEGGRPHGGFSRVVVSFQLTTIQAEATLQCTGCSTTLKQHMRGCGV